MAPTAAESDSTAEPQSVAVQACPIENGPASRELVLLEDMAAVASRVQSTSLRLAVDAADPGVAGGIAFFGLGAAVLPLAAALTGSSSANHDHVFSYAAHSGKESPEQLPQLYSEKELKERFGLIDLQFKLKELTLDANELEAHISRSPPETLRREARGIRRWKESASAALKLFQRRAALSYLGLAPGASEVDVSRIYKRLALELHPDKGGDADKFQTLQEMRQRTLMDLDKGKLDKESGDGGKDDNDDDDNDDVDVDTQGKPDLRVLRWEAHRSIVQLWDEMKKTRDEIDTQSAVQSSSQEVFHALRMFITNFINSDRQLGTEGCANPEKTLVKLTRMGGEIIAVASMLDPEATRSILETHLRSFLVTQGCPDRACKRYAALLQATRGVKVGVAELLQLSEEKAKPFPHADEVDEDDSEDCQIIDVPHECVPHSDAYMQPEKVESQLSAAGSIIQKAEAAEDENAFTFSPPSFRLGRHEVQLRMIGRGVWEKLLVDLWDGQTVVANLQGTYILRGTSDFFNACSSASTKLGLRASQLFEEDGRPASSWNHGVAAKACVAGLLFIENLSIQRPGPDMHRIALELVPVVLKCLAGPMKRVTLAISIDGFTSTSIPLRDLHSHMGFQPVGEGQCTWFLEVGASANARHAGIQGKGRSTVDTKPKANQSTTPKRKHPSESAASEGTCSSSQVPKLAKGPAQRPLVERSHDSSSDAKLGAYCIPTSAWDKLSPRVRFALATGASTGVTTLRTDAERFISGKPGEGYWGSESCAPHLQKGVFKAYVKGFSDVVSVIGRLLRQRQAPTIDAITQTLSPFSATPGGELGLQLNKHFVSHFFGVGGTVESAVLAVIDEASAVYDTFEDDDGMEDVFATYHALPIHMLDGDFEYVRSVLLPPSTGS